MSKNVAVFVDVANIFYAAKAAAVDIDYVTLLKSATAGRDFIRAYAYTGLDPENENQRQFQSFLARNGYKVVTKDIRKYGDGKVKANLDIELVVDMMKTARNVDIAVLVSGDGDFAPAIRAVQEMGVRVEVISFRGNTSSDLVDAADQFTEITQLAKVERSTRSGRRVAATETDLSMTAVPDKETEGAPRRRRRTTTKVAVVAEPVEAPAAAAPERVPARRLAARSAAEAIAAAGVPSLRVLPGERLARVGDQPLGSAEGPEESAAQAAGRAAVAEEGLPAPEVGAELAAETAEGPFAREGEGRRRRRRRGGRGRGRGRGREHEGPVGTEAAGPDEGAVEEPETEPTVPYAPYRPPQSAFGSIWDSQLGMNAPSRPPSADTGAGEEEEIEEPEIPEYLLAERRRGRGGRGGPGRGGRGGRGAYAAALERERFGRPGAPSRAWSPERGPRPGRGPGQYRAPVRSVVHERASAAEPWSEVPPDLEDRIRAQLAAARAPGTAEATPVPERESAQKAAPPARRRAASGRRSTRTRPAGEAAEIPASPAAGGEAGEVTPAPRRKRSTARGVASTAAAEASAPDGAPTATAPSAPRRPGRPWKAAPAPSAEVAETGAGATAAAPVRRTRSRKAAES